MTKRKEYAWYAVVLFVVIVSEIAGALALLPLLLLAMLVGFWAFDVKA